MSERPVLLFEDDPDTQEMMSEWFASLGRRVICASSAEEAARNLGGEKPDLVILDLQIGGADGLAMLSVLRSLPQCRDARAVIVTATHPNRVQQRLREAQTDLPVFFKPLDFDAFPRAIAELCGDDTPNPHGGA